MSRKWMKLIWIAPLALVGIAVFVFVGGEVVMRLWNWLLPSLFGWRQLTFWEALGMLALCRILFGGFGGHHGGVNRDHWRRRIMEKKCANMTPEERERFRETLRAKWGYDPTVSESKGQ